MCSFLRAIQKWRQDRRRHIEETEARQAMRQLIREKDVQRAQALLLIFSDLERTMDPAIAAQVYNNRFCPLLSRLPNELLLCICDFLRDDFVTLFCLRIVSRQLFHLLDSRRVLWGENNRRREHLSLEYGQLTQFRQLLQRDGRCDSCRRWNDAHWYQLSHECKFYPGARQVLNEAPNSSRHGTLHCYACDSLHKTSQFSSDYQQPQKHQADRRCLGQQGSVQLCEHIQITWARIKAHIDDWRQQRRGEDWRACLDSFNIECHDAMHDTRCTTSEAPTWPRAHLDICRYKPDQVALHLEWAPHSRVDAFGLTPDGRIPATELKAMFQRLRGLGPADTLCPASSRNAVPEMAFSPSYRFGRFVYYETGEDDEMGPRPASLPRLPSDSWPWWPTRYGCGENGTDLDINPHYIKGADGSDLSSQCLVVRYRKDILVCKTDAMTNAAVKINPTHGWLHAMDARTYPHPQAEHVRPRCSDLACVNQYLRRKNDCYYDRYEDV